MLSTPKVSMYMMYLYLLVCINMFELSYSIIGLGLAVIKWGSIHVYSLSGVLVTLYIYIYTYIYINLYTFTSPSIDLNGQVWPTWFIVLQACHDWLFSGHLSIRKTIDRVKQKFHWPRMRADVKDHIRNCLACAACKSPFKHYRAALADFRVGAPMDRVAIDLIGPLPLMTRKNWYIMVLVDYFTCWLEAFPFTRLNSGNCGSQNGDRVCVPFWYTPLKFTDQGHNFESDLFQEVCCLLEITKTRTTAYHPSSNGLVERCNGTLVSMIRSYLEDSDKDWDRFIPMLTAAYRSTVHSAKGFTPNYMMLSCETTTPVDLQFPCLDYEQGESFEYAQELRRQLSRCYEIAWVNLKWVAERQRKTHDTHIAPLHTRSSSHADIAQTHKAPSSIGGPLHSASCPEQLSVCHLW